jgi:hypothetical protein
MIIPCVADSVVAPDSGSGAGINQDSGSGLNITDP